jgi:hypothetical protein
MQRLVNPLPPSLADDSAMIWDPLPPISPSHEKTSKEEAPCLEVWEQASERPVDVTRMLHSLQLSS